MKQSQLATLHISTSRQAHINSTSQPFPAVVSLILVPFDKRYQLTALKSSLLQACGVVADTTCGHCARGFGRWEACIVNDPHSTVDPTLGSCANCFNGGQGKRCSLRPSLPQAILKNDKAATLDDVLNRTLPDLESAK